MSRILINQRPQQWQCAAGTSRRMVTFLWTVMVAAQLQCADSTVAQQPPRGEDQTAEQLFSKGRALLRENQPEAGMLHLRQAASNGLAQAQYFLASICLEPNKRDMREEGLRWCLEASRLQLPEARRLFVDALRDDDPGKHLAEARPWLLALAESGEKHFQFKAALWLFYGIGGSRDYKESFAWIRKAAAQESPDMVEPGAKYFEGYLYENGFETTQNYPAAARAYWLAARHGEVNAAFRLGLLLDHGQGLLEDRESARSLYLTAATLGLDRAQFQVARSLRDGRGGVTNIHEALDWLMQAARQGFTPAQTQLGIVFEKGWLGKEPDPIEAIAWYRQATAAGHRGAKIRVNNLERTLSATARESSSRRTEQLGRSIIRTPQDGRRLLGTNLLPEKLKEKLPADTTNAITAVGRPRTVFDARLRKTAGTGSDFLRDDLQAGKLRVYCEELQSAVRELATGKIESRYKQHGGLQPLMPDRMEMILSFRLRSDGRIADVDVVETNAGDAVTEAFVDALFQASPMPRWTPLLRAEMTDDHQDLLMAFGRESKLKIQP